MVWIDFRTIRQTNMMMTVLVIELLWTIGATPLLDVSFNVANFFAIPILIGFARHLGLQSVGAVIAIGSIARMLSSVILLPALIRLGRWLRVFDGRMSTIRLQIFD